MQYKTTRQILLAGIPIGGGAPVSIQSMTNTPTTDVDATVAQIERLVAAGVHIVRFGVPDVESAEAVAAIRQRVLVPLVADIHFNYKLALICMEHGVDALRINPGNLRKKSDVNSVIDCAVEHDIPLRIGINGGSLPPDLLEKYRGPTPEAMVEAAEREMAHFAERDFTNFKVSLKNSNVLETLAACRLFASKHDVPQHIGITEAGITETGLIRSGFGLGTLLAEGIGDTMRVSLTAAPEIEVTAAKRILATVQREVYTRGDDARNLAQG
jgi:(E)-4-hydroxy-3-methylbut-2-enyl-diphosphate synthase